MQKRWAFIALLVAAACGLQFIGCRGNLNVYDEGLALTGAMRVARGELPYRDFWTIYSPGQFYLLAAFMRFTGEGLIVLRHFYAAILAALAVSSAVLGGSLSRGSSSRRLTVTSILLVISATLCTSYRHYFHAAPVALLMAMLVLLLGAQPSPRRFFPAGLLTGLAVLFRHDIGVYLFGSVASVLLLYPQDRTRRLAPLGWYVAGSCVLPASCFGALVSAGAGSAMWDQLVVFPLTVYPGVRSLPWPLFQGSWSFPRVVETLATNAVILLFAYQFWRLLGLWRDSHRAHSAPDSRIVMMFAFGVACLLLAKTRPDFAHVFPSAMLALSLTPALLSEFSVGSKVLALVVATLFALTGVSASWRQWRASNGYCLSSGVGRGVCGGDATREYDEVIARLGVLTRPRERIYVGEAVHDRMLTSDAALYYLAGRMPACPWHELHPGEATKGTVQTAIAECLESTKVIVLRQSKPSREPNLSSKPTGVDTLDRFIKTRYLPLDTFERYSILTRELQR